MGKLEPTVILLSALVVFFTVALFVGEWLFKSDGQFYQTIAGLATGASGALLLRITGKPDTQHLVPPAPPADDQKTQQ